MHTLIVLLVLQKGVLRSLIREGPVFFFLLHLIIVETTIVSIRYNNAVKMKKMTRRYRYYLPYYGNYHITCLPLNGVLYNSLNRFQLVPILRCMVYKLL